MAMRFLRLQDYSIQFFLRNQLSFAAEKKVLTTKDNKVYKSIHKDWVINKPVVVYRNDIIVGSNEYAVNYLNGEIYFWLEQEALSQISVDYHYTWISISDSYPNETFNKPLLSIDTGPSREGAFQLGGGKWVYTMYHLNLFTMNLAQRDDMSQIIRESLDMETYLVDYNLRGKEPTEVELAVFGIGAETQTVMVQQSQGFPILSNGFLNPYYDENNQKTSRIYFDDVRVNPNPNKSGLDYERNRAIINFSAVSNR